MKNEVSQRNTCIYAIQMMFGMFGGKFKEILYIKKHEKYLKEKNQEKSSPQEFYLLGILMFRQDTKSGNRWIASNINQNRVGSSEGA